MQALNLDVPRITPLAVGSIVYHDINYDSGDPVHVFLYEVDGEKRGEVNFDLDGEPVYLTLHFGYDAKMVFPAFKEAASRRGIHVCDADWNEMIGL